MEARNLLAVSDLLKNNMDGFIKVYFESNLNIGELDDWNDSSVSLELKLFNKSGQSLFILVFNWEDFKNMECANDYNFESSMCVITGIESYDPQKKLEFKLFFPDSDFSCGECYIFEYEETREEEETDEKPVEVAKQQKVSQPISHFDDENKKMAKRRWLRNSIFVIVIIAVGVAYYIYKNPQIINEVQQFLKYH